jgi:hypothetical protein
MAPASRTHGPVAANLVFATAPSITPRAARAAVRRRRSPGPSAHSQRSPGSAPEPPPCTAAVRLRREHRRQPARGIDHAARALVQAAPAAPAPAAAGRRLRPERRRPAAVERRQMVRRQLDPLSTQPRRARPALQLSARQPSPSGVSPSPRAARRQLGEAGESPAARTTRALAAGVQHAAGRRGRVVQRQPQQRRNKRSRIRRPACNAISPDARQALRQECAPWRAPSAARAAAKASRSRWSAAPAPGGARLDSRIPAYRPRTESALVAAARAARRDQPVQQPPAARRGP